MGINIYSNSGHTAYGIKEFIVDTIKDLESLPLDSQLGSAALCLEDGKVYFYRPSKDAWLPLGEEDVE